jgi:hypothetical protein
MSSEVLGLLRNRIFILSIILYSCVYIGNCCWKTLKRIFAGQLRVTATFKQKDGRTLHVRKTTTAEPKLKQLYDALGLSASPGTAKKLMV